MTSNNSKNIRARKKIRRDNLFVSFFLFNGVLCSSLLLTVTAAGGHKVDRKKLSRSTMTSFNLKNRSKI